ncbi:MAG: adenosylmethionine decarboxylase [Candidatus Taylorbacteria bacterium]|nr:adenosylmethionine decarboxylase [Candidatus Taylorbacteria bacterium]
MKKKQRVKGAHYTVDFFGCDPHQLDSLEFWQKSLLEAAKEANMEVLHSYYHQFEPQGITGFLLLSTSHMSFHTWPEYNYVACDVFSCSRGDDTKKAVDYLKKALSHSRSETHKIKRGYVTMDYLTSPVYATGKNENIPVVAKLADIHSAFQHIQIVDTTKYGRCMVIDGLVQTSDLDHETYDRAILAKMLPKDRNILVLGGGDGYVAETALKMNPGAKITVVDLDPEVVNYAKKHLGQRIFSHPNVNLNIGDAVSYMETLLARGGEKFDGIVSDLTDNPIGRGDTKKEMKKFYSKIFSLSKTLLKEGGWFSAQAGASKVVRKYVDSAKILTTLAEEEFGNVERRDVLIPSFSEKNAFLYSTKEGS